MNEQQIRRKLYQLGYTMIYTFGINNIARIYPRGKFNGRKSYQVDMKDTSKGRREIEEIIKSLEA